jgi:LysM repeat protein
MNAQVRLGAYRIVGVDQTVTVRKGQTLASISKAFLGPGMECYVEALNDGVKTVSEGQKLKIPKLELRKKSAKK